MKPGRPRRKEGEWGERPSLAITANCFVRIYLCISAFFLDKEGCQRTSVLCTQIPEFLYFSHLFHSVYFLVQHTSNIGFYLLDVTIGRHTWNCQIRTHIHTKVHRHTKKTKMWRSKKETKRVFFFAGSSMFSYSLYLKCASSICRFSVMYRTEIPAPAVNGRQRVQGLHLCQECWCFTNFQYSKGTRAALEMMTNVDLNQHIQNCQ